MTSAGSAWWRRAALASLLVWLVLLGGALLVTARAGDSGIKLQRSSFSPVLAPPGADGLAIAGVVPRSAAARAGVREGDVLLTVDGVPIADPALRARAFFAQRAGDRSVLRLRRPGGATADVTLTLESMLARPFAPVIIATYAAAGGISLLIAVAVLLMRSEDAAARVLLVVGVSGAFWQAIDCYYGGGRERVLPLGWDPVDQLGYLVALVQTLAALHFTLIFPAPRRLASWLTPAGLAVLYGAPVAVAATLFALHQSAVTPVLGMAGVALLASLALVVYGYVRPATPLARAQLRWIISALLLVVLSLVAGPLVETVRQVPLVGWTTTVAAWSLSFLAIGLAVLRFRLQDTNAVLRATLLYPLLAGFLAAGYIAVGYLLTEVAVPYLPLAGDETVHVLLALTLAGLVLPLRQRLRRALDTVLNRERLTLRRYIEHTAEALARAQPPQALAVALTTEAVAALGLAAAWLVDDTGAVYAAAAPDAASEAPPSPPLSGPALLERLAQSGGPVALSWEVLPGFPVPLVRPEEAALGSWYRAGARLLIPLRAGTPSTAPPVGVWALAPGRTFALPDRDDMAALRRLGQQAAVLLDYDRIARQHLGSQRQLFEERMEREARRRVEAERQRAEAAIRESEARYRAVVEHSADGMAIVQDGRLVYANAAFVALHRLEDPAAAVGEPLEEIVLAADRPLIQQRLEAVLFPGEEDVTGVFEYRLRDGRGDAPRILGGSESGTRTVEAALVAIPYEGHPAVLLVARDITERRAMEQMREEFLSTVTHELRSPLTSVVGYTELLLLGDVGEITAEQREVLEVVKQNADRLNTLATDLLELSRIEAGRLTLHRQEVLLADALRGAALSIKPQVEAKHQTLVVLPAGDLPPVYADPQRLGQVLANLLSNAHKYTPAGGEIQVVATRARAKDGQRMARVDVRDSGIGLGEEEREQLFTRFFRSRHPQAQAVRGTGLGLVITRSLVEMQGGEITVSSTPGRGSTFSFTIPLYATPAEAPESPQGSAPAAAATATR